MALTAKTSHKRAWATGMNYCNYNSFSKIRHITHRFESSMGVKEKKWWSHAQGSVECSWNFLGSPGQLLAIRACQWLQHESLALTDMRLFRSFLSASEPDPGLIWALCKSMSLPCWKLEPNWIILCKKLHCSGWCVLVRFTSVDHVFVGSKFAYSILHLIALVQHIDYPAPSWFL